MHLQRNTQSLDAVNIKRYEQLFKLQTNYVLLLL